MDNEQAFEELLNYLRTSRGFDFSGYKRSSLMRRMQKRMQTLDIDSYSDYIDYLEVHPHEFTQLFNTILINVTNFFRDMPSWEALSQSVIPQMLASKSPSEPFRAWSAGCASGEEAYTLAIMLAEIMGLEAFQERVKIYATDIDEDALNTARQASYSEREVASIPPELIEKYFEHVDNRYLFRKDLRRSVIFGRHDLMQDAPISRIDLLICRNALMYFNAEAQARILARLHFALNEKGVLFLGRAEMLFTHTDSFTPLDLKRRLFTRAAKNGQRNRLLFLAQASNEAFSDAAMSEENGRVRDAAFEINPIAQVLINLEGQLTLANERARSLFSLSPRHLGQPFQDLEMSYRPLELRTPIDQANAERRAIHLKDIEWLSGVVDTRWFDILISPLFDGDGALVGNSISFNDVSRYRRLQEELQQSNQELEMAYEELQSTNEELETTNEELQSTIEELETTNEELQSTNEELETMNEELQSTNEELETINDELRRRSDELNQVNAFLASILSSFRSGVIVLDQELGVLVWNYRAEDLWGLRADEVQSKHFMNLDIGLPADQLHQPIRACLTGTERSAQVTVSAVNRRGKPIECRVTCSPLIGVNQTIEGVILLMEEI